MHRRQFLIGIAAVAITPVAASARRRSGFRFLSGGVGDDDDPKTRDRKHYLLIGAAGLVGLVAAVRGVFWVMKRLEDNPAPPRYVPPQSSPARQVAPAPVAGPRRTSAAPSFGKRSA